jgi:hypothetical protein
MKAEAEAKEVGIELENTRITGRQECSLKK